MYSQRTGIASKDVLYWIITIICCSQRTSMQSKDCSCVKGRLVLSHKGLLTVKGLESKDSGSQKDYSRQSKGLAMFQRH